MGRNAAARVTRGTRKGGGQGEGSTSTGLSAMRGTTRTSQ